MIEELALQFAKASGYYLALVVLVRLAGKRLAGQTTNSWLCAHFPAARHVIRGKPRALVRNGMILEAALIEEGISRAEFFAGLRKLGYEDPAGVKLATLGTRQAFRRSARINSGGPLGITRESSANINSG